MKLSKKRVALFAAVCAAAVTAVPLLGAADARLPCPCPGQGPRHHQKTKSLVGKYKGTTEEGGTVSFRLTSNRKIVGFTLTNATLYCKTETNSKIPTREPEYTKPLPKITHNGPIPMRGVSKKHPQGKEFDLSEPRPENVARQAGSFRGQIEDLLKLTPAGPVVLPEKGFIGEVEYETANGPTPFPSSKNPTPEWAPGTEWCVTKPIDWKAKKPGSPGYVPRRIR
jgi:hypothetical protein